MRSLQLCLAACAAALAVLPAAGQDSHPPPAGPYRSTQDPGDRPWHGAPEPLAGQSRPTLARDRAPAPPSPEPTPPPAPGQRGASYGGAPPAAHLPAWGEPADGRWPEASVVRPPARAEEPSRARPAPAYAVPDVRRRAYPATVETPAPRTSLPPTTRGLAADRTRGTGAAEAARFRPLEPSEGPPPSLPEDIRGPDRPSRPAPPLRIPTPEVRNTDHGVLIDGQPPVFRPLSRPSGAD
jgi:hypothetical protein